MSDNVQTPPETCPVCGADVLTQGLDQEGAVYVRDYACRATWATYRTAANPNHPWHSPCSHAMTAALRCGATLEPTPLETARAALVDAAVVVAHAFPATRDFPENDDAYATLTNAQIELDRLAEAYAALLEPAP